MRDLPSRVELLRQELVRAIPCKPDTQETRQSLDAMSLPQLMRVFVNWAARFIPQRKRTLTFARGFWTESANAHEKAIYELAQQIRLGEHLEPFLSRRIRTDGFVPAPTGRRRGIEWGDKDFSLNALDVHHLHLHPRRSDKLLFGLFYRDDAHLVLLGDHKSFDDGSLEEAVAATRSDHGHFVLRGIAPPNESYTAKQRNNLARKGVSTSVNVNGRMVIGAALSTAGTSIRHGQCTDAILRSIRELEPKLDDPDFVAKLCSGTDIVITDPCWSFHYTDLGISQRESTNGALILQRGLC